MISLQILIQSGTVKLADFSRAFFAENNSVVKVAVSRYSVSLSIIDLYQNAYFSVFVLRQSRKGWFVMWQRCVFLRQGRVHKNSCGTAATKKCARKYTLIQL
jgi:hypothetical protein